MINPNVKIDLEFLSGFCRKWQICELSIFGSALRDDFNAESDLDFLVSFEVGMELDVYKLLDMKEELEGRHGRTVDLIEKETLRNPWRRSEILRTREVIFAA
jgi:uncharacterized protein